MLLFFGLKIAYATKQNVMATNYGLFLFVGPEGGGDIELMAQTRMPRGEENKKGRDLVAILGSFFCGGGWVFLFPY